MYHCNDAPMSKHFIAKMYFKVTVHDMLVLRCRKNADSCCCLAFIDVMLQEICVFKYLLLILYAKFTNVLNCKFSKYYAGGNSMLKYVCLYRKFSKYFPDALRNVGHPFSFILWVDFFFSWQR